MVKSLSRFGKLRIRLSSAQIVVLGFAALILVGAILLCLPISSAQRQFTPFLDSLFTATTSVCVTGLVVQDTGTYWSTFGHAVILLLIQVGGLGVVTVAASFTIMAGKKIGLFQRSTMQDAVASPQMGGVVKLTDFLLKATFLVEGIGAVLIAPVLIGDYGWPKGIWMSVFTSISAFCNAGIDLFGGYNSLTKYIDNPLMNISIMLLIVVAGLGFLTWHDIYTHGIHVKKYRMQSKLILTVTGLLILVPAVLFFLLEFRDMPLKERILASLFQSVTTRTAGFNTADLGAMSESGKIGMICLMLVGGSPGSTAGGMKTTTFAVLVGCAYAVFRQRDAVQFYGRRIAADVISTAMALAFLYVGLSVGSAMVMSRLEGLPFVTCWFETTSAIATVGLTLGVTPTLGTASRIMVILLMYLGRVGGLTLIYATLSNKKQMGKYPLDKLIVG